MNKHPPSMLVSRFKFYKTRTSFDSYEILISEHWICPASGSPMHALHYKLKDLKAKLKNWSKVNVGDFYHRISTIYISSWNPFN
jgi:hypothetical protein